MERRCLGYPEASTVASQPLYRILPPWLANPSNSAMNPHSNSGRKKNKGWEEGEDANWTTPQTTAQTLNEELADPSSVQIYFVPCEPALMRLTVGCPLSSWAARPLSLWTTFKTCGPLNLWTTEPLSSWTAWPLSLWTTWPPNSWTTWLLS